ncbi:amino acid adenylation domain-containing protein [Virgibacillus sp. NKC19-3]|uniref:non-ribosomal peptide synthetase n=1 Tax=Virgibacillus saliphilus TaxID=2831674 RepID=UPI001C9AFE2B|nr:non-ribosomal peptide synthetase [Virgibacillus sp. NKC19-3]MBY7142460.1 amino acid adenylation domain-containing protein [Virgibacillus sp. NKC19-3]
MKINELIDLINTSNVILKYSKEINQITVHAPEGAIDSKMLELIKEHKKELIMYLAMDENNLKLSPVQEKFYLLNELDASKISLNIPLGIELKGSLNLVALEKSINHLYQCHDALRSFVKVEGDLLLSDIVVGDEIVLPTVDIRKLPKSVQEKEVKRIIKSESEENFNLEKGPLLRPLLIKKSSNNHILIIISHHFSIDGYSVDLIYRKLVEYYKYYSSNESWNLFDDNYSYRQYTRELNQQIDKGMLENQISYWEDKIGSKPSILRLPVDKKMNTLRAKTGMHSQKGKVLEFNLSSILTQRIKKLSNTKQVTLFMTLLAAFKVLLHMYSKQDDVILSTVISRRNRKELEEVVGPLGNTLLIRSDLSRNLTFDDFLLEVSQNVIKAYSNQDIPFENLVKALPKENFEIYNELTKTAFIMHTNRASRIEVENLCANVLNIEKRYTANNLKLDVWETDHGLKINAEYNTELFNEDTIKRLCLHYEKLLEKIVSNPSKKISEFHVTTKPELTSIHNWNDTTNKNIIFDNVKDIFENLASNFPTKIALISEDEQLSYEALNKQANELAYTMKSKGIDFSSRVGVCLDRSIECIASILGVLKLGATFVPIDTRLPDDQINFIIKDANLSLIIKRERKKVLGTEDIFLNIEDCFKSSGFCDYKNPKIKNQDRDSIVYIIYTSGSTGQPKGILANNTSMINRVKWQWNALPYQESEVCCHKSPLSFVDGIYEVFCPLLFGQPLLLVPDDIVRNVFEFLKLIDKYNVSRITIVPSYLRVLLSEIKKRNLNISSLKYCVSSGEVLSTELVGEFFDTIKGCNLYNLYGSSEVAADVTWYDTSNLDLSLSSESAPIGRPVDNTQIYILDKNLRIAPIGVQGEIYVGGLQLSKGYVNNERLTDEKFITNPFDRRKLFFKTGDMGRYLSNGLIEYCGRFDSQINIRGYRIELGQIESVINKYSKVKESVVIKKDKNENQVLVCFLVINDNESISLKDLKSYLKNKLAWYMVPNEFVILEKIPYTITGKIDKLLLLNKDYVSSRTEEECVGNISCIQNELLDLISRIMNTDKMSVKENFFDIGADSLSLVRLLSEVNSNYGTAISFNQIYDNPSVIALSEVVEKELINTIMLSNNKFINNLLEKI